jgi:hypothetical protein
MRKLPGLIEKDPASDEPWGFDWTSYLAELGEGVTIATSTWSVTGPDSVLTIHDGAKVGGDLKTQIYLAAGTLGAKYTVTNHVVTNSSPPVVDEQSFLVQITNQ